MCHARTDNHYPFDPLVVGLFWSASLPGQEFHPRPADHHRDSYPRKISEITSQLKQNNPHAGCFVVTSSGSGFHPVTLPYIYRYLV